MVVNWENKKLVIHNQSNSLLSIVYFPVVFFFDLKYTDFILNCNPGKEIRLSGVGCT